MLIKNGQSMNSGRFRYTHKGNPGAILRAARITLGLSAEDVRFAVNQQDCPMSHWRFREIELDTTGDRIGAVEWWVLCQHLALGCDSLSFGYCEREHLMRARGAIEDGKLLMPVTDFLRERLDKLAEAERYERWLQDAEWRPGLRVRLCGDDSRSEFFEL